MSVSPIATSPSADDAQKLKEAQLKIGMALKNAQYALTTHAHRGLTTALHENVNALTALSTYLSLSGSPVKAAAIAGQMAKILKSVATYVAAKERGSGGGSSHHGTADNSHHNSGLNTPASSVALPDDAGFPPGTPREAGAQLAELQNALEEMTRQRDKLAATKQTLEAQLAAVSVSATPLNEAVSGGDGSEATLQRLRGEVDVLKREVREGQMKAAALGDQLHEAQEQIEDQQDQIQALKSQLRISQEEKISQDAAFAKKEEEIKALQESLLQNSRQVSATMATEPGTLTSQQAAQAPRGYVDKDDFDALKLQNQLLQQALREQATKVRPTDTQSAITQQTLEELEADHQQQLEAMKLTIQEQFNRETELLNKQRDMQDTINDLQRQLQLSSNRHWVQQEREKHLNEMDAAKAQIEALQNTIEKQQGELQQHKERIGELEDVEKKMTEANKNLKVRHETQVAELTEAMGAVKEEIEDLKAENSTLREQLEHQRDSLEARLEERQQSGQARLTELQKQLAAEQEQRAAAEATVVEHDTASQQQLADLKNTHEGALAQLQARLASENQHAETLQARLEEEAALHKAQLKVLEEQLETEHKRSADAEDHAAKLEITLSQLRKQMAADSVQHDTELSSLKQDSDAVVAKLTQQLEEQRQRADFAEGSATERDAGAQQRVAQLQSTIDMEREKHDAELRDLKQSHEAELTQLREALAAQQEQQKVQLSELQDSLAAQHEQSATAAAAAQQQITELQQTLETERQQHGSQVAELKVSHEAELTTLQEQLHEKQALAEAAESRAVEQDKAAKQQLQEIEAHVTAEIKELNDNLTAEREHHASELAEARSTHDGELKKLTQQLEEQRQRADFAEGSATERDAGAQQRVAQLQSTIDMEREKHDAELRDLKQSHEAELTQLREALAAQQEQQKVQLSELQDSLAAQHEQSATAAAAAQQQITELQQTLETERQQHGSQVAELKASQEERLTEAKRELEAKVGDLSQQLKAERARADSAESSVTERDAGTQQRMAQLQNTIDSEREQHCSKMTEMRQAHEKAFAELKLVHQAQLAELQKQHDAAATERGLLERQAAELTEKLAAEGSRADKAEAAMKAKAKEAAKSVKEAEEKQAAEVAEMKAEHEAVVKRLQEDTLLQVKRVKREMAGKVTVASQPVDWLKDENEALKQQCRDSEEKCKTATKEKIEAMRRAREAEQTLASRKSEVKRLKDECSALQETVAKAIEEKDSAVKQLASSARAAEEARANAARLTSLREEMQELQQRWETAEKDKNLLVARYKRATTEKEECAEATRKLLAQYKETAAALEKLKVQNAAAAAAAAAEQSDRVNRSRDLVAEVKNNLEGSAASSPAADAPANKIQSPGEVVEMKKLMDALVAQLDEVKEENAQLQSELAAVRQTVISLKATLSASPAPLLTRKETQDTMGSLAKMRRVLFEMHAEAVPALDNFYQRQQVTTPADAMSTGLLDAVKELYAAMEEAHSETQATLAHFNSAARRLRASAELQGVIYGKLLATLRSSEASANASYSTASPTAMTDVALLRACTALFTEICVRPVEDSNGRHASRRGDEQQHPSRDPQEEEPTRATSSSRGRSLPVSQHAFLRPPPAMPTSAAAESACRMSPIRHRNGEREEVRYIPHSSPYRRASFENFAAAQASISAAEQHAGLRPAPTPPWK